jgi:hypothetical protein
MNAPVVFDIVTRKLWVGFMRSLNCIHETSPSGHLSVHMSRLSNGLTRFGYVLQEIYTKLFLPCPAVTHTLHEPTICVYFSQKTARCTNKTGRRPVKELGFIQIYRASVLFGHEEAGKWARLASPAIGRKQDRVKTKCKPCITRIWKHSSDMWTFNSMKGR